MVEEVLNSPLARAASVVGYRSTDAMAEQRYAAAPPRLLPFNAVFGNVVNNHRGQVLGTLSEVLLDLSHGRIAYAIVSRGGFMGRGERLYPVPWAALARDSDRHCFILDTERERFDLGPSFGQSDWPSIFDSERQQQVNAYYEPLT